MGLSLECDQIFRDDLPDTVTYTAYGEAGTEIEAIFTQTHGEQSDYDDGMGLVFRGVLRCSAEDAPSPDERDSFTIDSDTWQVSAPAVVKAGIVMFELVRYVRRTVTGPEHRRRR